MKFMSNCESRHLDHRPVSSWLHFEKIYLYLKEFHPYLIDEALRDVE